MRNKAQETKGRKGKVMKRAFLSESQGQTHSESDCQEEKGDSE